MSNLAGFFMTSGHREQEVLAARMMVREQMPGSMPVPVVMTQHEQILDIVLRPGSIEMGLRQVECLSTAKLHRPFRE